MEVLTPLGAFSWSALGLISLVVGFYVLILIRGRVAMRTIEATHASQHGLHEQALPFEKLPKRLQELLHLSRPELEQLGFRELFTGARLKLNEGGADNYHQIFVSPDKTAVLEISLVRVPLVLGFWPVALPFSNIIGPSVMSIAIETLFSDDTTLITSSCSSVAEHGMSNVTAVIVGEDISIKDMFKKHKSHQEQLASERSISCKLFRNNSDFFEKERIQREQIAAKDALWLESLREETNADIWNPSGR